MTEYKDKETLSKLYHEEGLTQREIAEKYGVTRVTISDWMNRHDIKTVQDGPWEDKSKFEELFKDRGMTLSQMAEEWDCGRSTIHRWKKRHGIDRIKANEYRVVRKRPARYSTTKEGYELSENQYLGDSYQVGIHRLVAVAEYGIEAVKDKVVHHKNEIPWDNRPENLEIMSAKEHTSLHNPVQHRWNNDN